MNFHDINSIKSHYQPPLNPIKPTILQVEPHPPGHGACFEVGRVKLEGDLKKTVKTVRPNCTAFYPCIGTWDSCPRESENWWCSQFFQSISFKHFYPFEPTYIIIFGIRVPTHKSVGKQIVIRKQKRNNKAQKGHTEICEPGSNKCTMRQPRLSPARSLEITEC